MNAHKYTNGQRDYAGEKDAKIQELEACVADLLEACELAAEDLDELRSVAHEECHHPYSYRKKIEFLWNLIAKRKEAK